MSELATAPVEPGVTSGVVAPIADLHVTFTRAGSGCTPCAGSTCR